ncbi:AI-2E family transporter [Candidatus Nomurabacteria bacterium]|uniref:AI-2E family transporter n=1 Tax=candidate division WWE3 bacterium TaxID=2053526 RepID=A0A955DZF3_UNCKA|nr:AI-2E family transporter [candidate division WWE3 bacterium]MCB9823843.1 AI-2E family transporter [Candidatus Nomurabacteria bacterium]MCB9826752.1 AI-2E family transporter [Candidatus Nomurabacteria bacterium]MCB9827637.1 AI-2E family transporter [Candidatus Nomurabacteria bacterium]HXK52804.1 AI-2E family transporter [bacterium]
MDRQIIISIKTILLVAAGIATTFIVYQMRGIFLILLIALLLVISLEHAVLFFQKQTVLNKPVPRSLAVIMAYLSFVLIILLAVTVVMPPVLIQTQILISKISGLSFQVQGTEFKFQNLVPDSATLSSQLFNRSRSLFTNLANIMSVLILALYISLDWENMKRRGISLLNDPYKTLVKNIISEIEVSIGQWVKGQAILMLTIGSISTVGLLILDVDYAIPLGIAAGMLEVVPLLGPIVATVLAGIVGFTDSYTKGLAVTAMFIIVQQLENNLLVPKIMHKVSGFSPLVILMAMLIGTDLLGVVGALLAIPMMMIGVIVFRRVAKYPVKS